jgi:hypothetical protein
MSNRLRSLDCVMFCLAVAWVGLTLGCEGRIGEGTGVDATSVVVVDAAGGVVDATAVDAPSPVIDAAIDAPAPPATCDDLYGTAVEYILCDQQPDTCEFNVRTNGGNCTQLCYAFGSTCVAAYDNQADPGTECVRVEATGDVCTTTRNTEICVCTR